MKRFLSFFLVVIALFCSAITYTVSKKEAIKTVTNYTTSDERTSAGNTQQALFHPLSLFISSSHESLHNSESLRVQQTFTRLHSGIDHALRLKSFKQLVHLQFLAGQVDLLLNAAFRQKQGYYLYHLRKLLI